MKMGNTKFTLLVLSCDAYSDCWDPFFLLLERYWPEIDAPILLATDSLDYSHPRLPVTVLKHAPASGKRLDWSDGFAAALRSVCTPLVLPVLDDFFLTSRVNDEVIRRCVALMQTEPIDSIGLHPRVSGGPAAPEFDLLWRRDRRSRYLITTNAQLWRVDALRSYLRPAENAWQYEIFGTRRARRKGHRFYKVREDQFSAASGGIMPYMHEAVVRGKWHSSVPAAFRDNGISVPFERRGFYVPVSPLKRRIETLSRLTGNPLRFILGMAGR